MFTFGQHLFGQESALEYGYPLIHNYTSKEYLVAENVNWAATQDELGNMYFANNNGVLKFDGNYWTLIGTINEALSISYDSASKSIYVGCHDDFGYIKVEKNGKLVYKSLAEQLKIKENLGQIWDCISTPEGIYFNSQNGLLRYKNGTIKKWKSKTNYVRVFYTGGKILIRESGVGILCLENDNLSFVRGSEPFADNRIVYIGNTKNNPNEFILASREKGLFRFELIQSNNQYSIKLELINKNTLDLFSKNLIFNGISLSDNSIALSTILGGLIIVDKNGNLRTQLNSKNGLNCDYINSVFEDQKGNLWLATDNGISLVMHSLPVSNFENSGNIAGIVESIAKIKNNIFVGTSTGIFKYNDIINQFEKLDFPSIQVWQLIKLEEENALLAATAKGVYKIYNNGKSQLISSNIENVLAIFKSKKHHNIYYIGHSTGISAYKYENGHLNLIYANQEINFSIRSIVEDDLGNIWLSTQYDGLIYMFTSNLETNSKNNYLNFIKYTTENGLPHLNENFVSIINNEVVVSTYNGIYKFNKKKHLSSYSIAELANLNFLKDPAIAPYKNAQDIQTKKLKLDSDNKIWMISLFPNGKYDFGCFTPTNKNNQWVSTPYKIISKDKIDEFFIDSNIIWFGGSDLISCFNHSKRYQYDSKYFASIKYVISASDTIFHGNYYQTLNNKGAITNQLSSIQPKELVESFAYQNNDFTFHFAASSFIANNPCKFSCYLEGEDEKWSEWSNETFKTYMNLYEGNYIFKVKAKNIFGNESTVASYEFRIHPPWYRTALAYILYFVLAFVLVYGIVVIYTRNLNRIIKNQTAELQQQKDEIVHKNKEITDSIYYAKRIQDAIMPSNEYIKNMFADSFVFFKPKDIVSGDFYWANLRDNNAILAAVDCTGHGVPGAFMSMMGNDYLNDIIVDSKINEPSEILNRMRSGIIKALKQRGESGESKDGMDMSLVNINKETSMLVYAGANNPLYIVRDKNQPVIENALLFSAETDKKILYEIKGNKFPVGIHMGTTLQPFSKREIQLLKGDVVYMFSDGYADQFGGPSSKKLKYNQFKKFILESMFLTMEEQKIYLEQKLNEWQGDLEQVDDVLVMGVRIV